MDLSDSELPFLESGEDSEKEFERCFVIVPIEVSVYFVECTKVRLQIAGLY